MWENTTQTLTNTDNVYWEKKVNLSTYNAALSKKKIHSRTVFSGISKNPCLYWLPQFQCSSIWFRSCIPCARTVELKWLCFESTLGEHARVLDDTLRTLFNRQKWAFKKSKTGWVSSFFVAELCLTRTDPMIALRKMRTTHVHFSHGSLQCHVSLTSLWPAHNRFGQTANS